MLRCDCHFRSVSFSLSLDGKRIARIFIIHPLSAPLLRRSQRKRFLSVLSLALPSSRCLVEEYTALSFVFFPSVFPVSPPFQQIRRTIPGRLHVLSQRGRLPRRTDVTRSLNVPRLGAPGSPFASSILPFPFILDNAHLWFYSEA